MDFLTILASIILLTIVAFLVGFPMIRPVKKNDRINALLAELDDGVLAIKDKESILTSINEIEFDYKMKKLSEDDYQILKNKYKQVALEILHEEEREEFSTTQFLGKNKAKLEEEIEAEIDKELKAKG